MNYVLKTIFRHNIGIRRSRVANSDCQMSPDVKETVDSSNNKGFYNVFSASRTRVRDNEDAGGVDDAGMRR